MEAQAIKLFKRYFPAKWQGETIISLAGDRFRVMKQGRAITVTAVK